MTLTIYAIRDIKTGYLGLTLDQNDAAAMRNFEHAMSKTDSLMHSHSKDYSLYRMGSYDTDLGEITECYKQLIMEG